MEKKWVELIKIIAVAILVISVFALVTGLYKTINQLGWILDIYAFLWGMVGAFITLWTIKWKIMEKKGNIKH